MLTEIHNFDVDEVPVSGRDATRELIVAQDDCCIGAHSTVPVYATIGHDSVVAADTVACADVHPYSAVDGAPARFLRLLSPASVNDGPKLTPL